MHKDKIVADVTELVKYIIYSDYVELDTFKKETPLSAILVAPVEHGKTAIIEQFVSNRGILCVGDLTAWGIQHVYLGQMKKGIIKRIMIPDMINPANRKQETVDSLITFFNSYISWEGVRSIATYAMRIKLTEPLRGSLLTTMATKDFKRMTSKLAAVGFLSRLLIIGYKYDKNIARDILIDIALGKNPWNTYKFDLPETQVKVHIPDALSLELIPQAEYIGRRADGVGNRAVHQLKMLSKCKALSEGRETVTKEDTSRIIELSKLYLSRIPDVTWKAEKMIYDEAEKEAKRYEEIPAEDRLRFVTEKLSKGGDLDEH